MGGIDLPLVALRAQLASAVDIVVQTARLRDGRRLVTHITEVAGPDPERGYRVKDLFAGLPARADARGQVRFELEPTGVLPDCLRLIPAQGFELPHAMYAANGHARRGG